MVRARMRARARVSVRGQWGVQEVRVHRAMHGARLQGVENTFAVRIKFFWWNPNHIKGPLTTAVWNCIVVQLILPSIFFDISQ